VPPSSGDPRPGTRPRCLFTAAAVKGVAQEPLAKDSSEAVPQRGAADEKDWPMTPCGRQRAGASPAPAKLTSSRCRGPVTRPKTRLPRAVMVQLRRLGRWEGGGWRQAADKP